MKCWKFKTCPGHRGKDWTEIILWQGNSGGQLVVKSHRAKCKYEQVGIVSWGIGKMNLTSSIHSRIFFNFLGILKNEKDVPEMETQAFSREWRRSYLGSRWTRSISQRSTLTLHQQLLNQHNCWINKVKQKIGRRWMGRWRRSRTAVVKIFL